MRSRPRLAPLALAALTRCSSPSAVLGTIAPVRGAVHPGTPKIVVPQQIGTARYLERSHICDLERSHICALVGVPQSGSVRIWYYQ